MSSPPFKVKAVYEYKSPHEDDLSFPDGQIITVTGIEDADWYVGEYTDAAGEKREGLFPNNFVEKYEPAPPPRPVRAPRPKPAEAPAAPPEAPVEQVPQQEPHVEKVEPEHEQRVSEPSRGDMSQNTQSETLPVLPLASTINKAPEEPVSTKPAPPASAPKAAPAVAEKSSSFRDRIAAFNKPAAAPIAPFKPGAPPSGFIKKPFIAPPPSRDAYVPPPRDPAPQKVYKRDEDLEIAERGAPDQENAEKAGLTSPVDTDKDAEDVPKPTSLKERIALLQKQQAEQAARRAEVAHKEKPKRPPKKRAESHEREAQETHGTELERVQSGEATERVSSDLSRETTRAPPANRLSRGPRSPDAVPRHRELFSDANDADQSNAGETTEEAEGTSTGVDEQEETSVMKPAAAPSRASAAPPQEPDVGDEEDTTEEDNEEEMDPEARRQMELRERMAKLSGGMGMPGMGMAGVFGPPEGMPMPGSGLKKKKPAANAGRTSAEDAERASIELPPQRMPMIPVPGMGHVRSPDSEGTELAVGKEPDEGHTITGEHSPDEVPDIEDVKREASLETQPEALGVPPPPPTRQGIAILFEDLDSPTRWPLRALENPRQNTPPLRKFYGFTDGGSELVMIIRVLKRPVPPPPPTSERSAPPPIPAGRPEPSEPISRPVRPPPPATPPAPSTGSESDDEMPESAQDSSLPIRGPPPPIPGMGAPPVPIRPEGPRSPQSPPSSRVSYLASDPTSPTSPTAASITEKRTSRVPPIPVSSPSMPPAPAQSRPPPPPPPTAAPPSRQGTSDTIPRHHVNDEGDEGETDYEGDYDTDIASSAKHKDALKFHARESSHDDSTTADEAPIRSPIIPSPTVPPPISPSSAHRPVPPPPPHASNNRISMDAPRAVPPIPYSREAAPQPAEDEYDSYHHVAPVPRIPPRAPTGPPPMPAPVRQESEDEEDQDEDDLYSGPPARKSVERPPPPPSQAPPHQDRPVPPPPSHMPPPVASSTGQSIPRKSLEAERTFVPPSRRSTDQPRPSSDRGYIATDIDLGAGSHWWAQANTPPPVFQNRKDVLFEIEESSSTKRGGKTTISKDVYVLFQDYSQTVVTARFDSRDVNDVSLEQRHEAPPSRLRQDQLEEAHARFGQRISEDAASKQNTVVGDGSPQALVLELLKPLPSALRPVGTRAYGALVYANLANASVQQYDEIRPGDITTMRNARFQGKHGAMHAKYSMDVGKPDHVAVVVDWDGRKKKVRAWEQGRESRKVKMESFKVEDLRSGEVRVWRVMGRGWVGWDDGS